MEADTGVFSRELFYVISYKSQDASLIKLLLSVLFSVCKILVTFFVSAVDSYNDTVSLLGPMFCIAFCDGCPAAVVH